MSDQPSWLPDLLSVDGEPQFIFERLHDVFTSTLRGNKQHLDGLPIRYDGRIDEFGYEEGFWHLVTRGQGEDRYLDTRRAERLPWCAAVIGNVESEDVTRWDYREPSGRIRTYLWLEREDYVVIVERSRRGDCYFLVTTYYVEGNSTRKRLAKKYQNRVE